MKLLRFSTEFYIVNCTSFSYYSPSDYFNCDDGINQKIKTGNFYFFELFDVNWFVWLIWVKLSADGHQVSLSIWIMGLHHMEIIQNYKAIFDPVDANRIGFFVQISANPNQFSVSVLHQVLMIDYSTRQAVVCTYWISQNKIDQIVCFQFFSAKLILIEFTLVWIILLCYYNTSSKKSRLTAP